MKTNSKPQGHTLNLSAAAPQRSVAQGTLTASELRYTADVIAQRGVLEQSTAFIAKPFTRVELACKVRSVLDAREPAKPEARAPRAGE